MKVLPYFSNSVHVIMSSPQALQLFHIPFTNCTFEVISCLLHLIIFADLHLLQLQQMKLPLMLKAFHRGGKMGRKFLVEGDGEE